MLNKEPIVDVFEECIKIQIVNVDTLENHKESFNDLKISFSKVLILLDFAHIRLNLVFKIFRVFQIRVIEDNVSIKLSLIWFLLFEYKRNILANSLQISNDCLTLRTKFQKRLTTVICVVKEIHFWFGLNFKFLLH